ncbi:hypothetical protein [Halorhabdus salina]|uniref:hypothetical protein n=1 Tax=Halorhabdus salina TaxID=2750670 RepID=UPI00215DABED|nr:hypothetical protein [Halorhabdus salina]
MGLGPSLLLTSLLSLIGPLPAGLLVTSLLSLIGLLLLRLLPTGLSSTGLLSSALPAAVITALSVRSVLAVALGRRLLVFLWWD